MTTKSSGLILLLLICWLAPFSWGTPVADDWQVEGDILDPVEDDSMVPDPSESGLQITSVSEAAVPQVELPVTPPVDNADDPLLSKWFQDSLSPFSDDIPSLDLDNKIIRDLTRDPYASEIDAPEDLYRAASERNAATIIARLFSNKPAVDGTDENGYAYVMSPDTPNGNRTGPGAPAGETSLPMVISLIMLSLIMALAFVARVFNAS